MKIALVEGCTRVCGIEQGYQGLPIRDETAHPSNLDYPVNRMVTKWEPTEEERTRLLAGEAIYLTMLGSTPSPVMLGVGDPAVYGW